MTTEAPYSTDFFKKIESGSVASARVVIPVLLDLLRPHSVVDIGCGAGAWLSVVRQLGISDIQGIDGDYVNRAALMIPQEKFQAADLGTSFRLNRRYDMAMSLEVAEHIEARYADTYLDNLTMLSDTIVFSAAIPNQTGTGHVNEQWPEYWKEKFEARGYVLIDCLRHRFWTNRDVERWYRQNLLLYVTQNRLRESPVLLNELESARERTLALVHPASYIAPSLSAILHMIPGTLSRAFKRRLSKAPWSSSPR